MPPKSSIRRASARTAATRVFFGATVTYRVSASRRKRCKPEQVVSIVGIDEVDLNRRYISWMSPLARALMRSSPGDRVVLRAPKKTEHLEIVDIEYDHPDGPVSRTARRRSGHVE